MRRTPWLGAFNFLIDAKRFQVVALINIVRFYTAFKLRLKDGFKRLGKFLADNKAHLAETSLNGIVNRVVYNGFAMWAKAVNLFHASVTAGHPCGQYQ